MGTHKVRKIDRFDLLKRLGKGAEGSVFLAWDPSLERRVAIKVLLRRAARQEARDGLAPPEARLAGKLSHANIVPVYETGRIGRYPYVVFEYVSGLSLRAVLKHDGAFDIERACALMGSVLDGVAHAHDHGIIHLDLSPGNIIVDEAGVPRVMDFGLAQITHAPSSAGARPRGTLRYMAPEHFGTNALGPWTDVYALGLIIYELVTGVPARTADTASRAVKQIVEGTIDLQPLRDRAEGGRLVRFLEGALAHEPTARYADARQMRAALHAAFPGDASSRGERHGTVDFLLRRMGRRDDFPALSSSLTAINRATSSDSKASANQLAGVILCDYALAQKVLKLANSAFYGGGARGEVSSVSTAVRLLGFEQIRLAAYSVTLLDHFQRQNGGQALSDMLLRAFMAGLVTRHLVKHARLPGAEEAFICGMFHNLGEHLTLHYFPEEHAAIDALVIDQGLRRDPATRAILGITYGELGYAVAKAWQLPEIIADSIAAQPDDVVTTPKSVDEAFAHYAAFANELCLLPSLPNPALAVSAVATLVERFEPSFSVPETMLYRVLEAALEKLAEFAPVLGLQFSDSDFCRAARELLAWRAALAQADATETVINPALCVA